MSLKFCMNTGNRTILLPFIFLLHATTDCPWGTTFLILRTQLTVIKVIVIDLLKINHRKRYLGELPIQLFHAASVKRM